MKATITNCIKGFILPAFASVSLFAHARTLSMEPVTDDLSAITGFRLTFESSAIPDKLYAVYDAIDNGSAVDAWPNRVMVADVPAGTTEVSVEAQSIPGFGTTTRAVAFFLSGYDPDMRELEWIESSNSQYIDTGYVGSQNVTYDAKFSIPSSYNNTSIFLAASRWKDVETDRYTVLQLNTSGNFVIGLNDQYNGSTHASKETIYVARAVFTPGIQSLQIDGNVVAKTSVNVAPLNTTCPLFLFARNNGGTAGNFGPFRLYSFKISEGDNVVRDYIPCLSNNVACLYDKVSKKCFFNGANTSFSASEPIGHIDIGGANAVLSDRWVDSQHLAAELASVAVTQTSAVFTVAVSSCGAVGSADIIVHYGDSADALTETKTIGSVGSAGTYEFSLEGLPAASPCYARIEIAGGSEAVDCGITPIATLASEDAVAGLAVIESEDRLIVLASPRCGHAGKVALNLAYDIEDKGAVPESWANVEGVGFFSGCSQFEVQWPAGWKANWGALCFFACEGMVPDACYLKDLRTDGSQYIDTGYVYAGGEMTVGGRVTWREEPTGAATDTSRHLFSAQQGSVRGMVLGLVRSVYPDTRFLATAGDVMMDYGVKVADFAMNSPTDFEVTLNDGQKSVSAEFNSGSIAYSGSASPGISQYLFAQNRDGSAYKCASLAFEHLSVTTNGALALDFYPAVSNGVVCVYDKVGRRFLYNQTASAFVPGEAGALIPLSEDPINVVQSKVIGLGGIPFVVVSSVEADKNAGTVAVNYKLVTAGQSSSSADIYAVWGPKDGDAVTTNRVAQNAVPGLNAVVLDGMYSDGDMRLALYAESEDGLSPLTPFGYYSCSSASEFDIDSLAVTSYSNTVAVSGKLQSIGAGKTEVFVEYGLSASNLPNRKGVAVFSEGASEYSFACTFEIPGVKKNGTPVYVRVCCQNSAYGFTWTRQSSVVVVPVDKGKPKMGLMISIQ